MPTEKPRITFTVDEEMHNKITDYKYSHRIKNQSQAILSLLEQGLDKLENANSEILDIEDIEEHPLLYKYSKLDDHGKAAVDAILDIEYDRCSSPSASVTDDELDRLVEEALKERAQTAG